ncbi:MAG: glycosyltransferase family 2 protein [Kordiimonadaceae bacterium]|nr:glycosyltransferase family 2 protein [Kordiimonadaceae bacterium]MBT6035338.1 glycosyltransferase family 2 protein [Kordiimonadaceae bacterium]
MDQGKTKPVLSVVVPLFNEQQNILPLIERLTSTMNEIDASSEIILVDDGSQDGTWFAIQSVCKDHKNIKGLRFSRNFGHQHAIFAGLKQASGQAIVSMDGDLQHPPEVIPELYTAWKKGANIVNTVRDDADVTGHVKRLFSRVFYKIFSMLCDVSLSEGSSDFRLIDRKVLKEIISFGDVDVFLRGAIEWVGYDVEVVKFKPEERHLGKTKFTISRMMKLAGGAIVSYSTIP